jgi:para-nitrobenzyl esterase
VALDLRLTGKLAEAERAGEQFAESVGVHSAQELRAKPAVELQKAAAQGQRFSPSMDGWMLPEDVYSIFAHGKQNDVPLLAGWNADEGTTLSSWPANKTAADFIAEARHNFGERSDQFLTLYPAGSDQEARGIPLCQLPRHDVRLADAYLGEIGYRRR